MRIYRIPKVLFLLLAALLAGCVLFDDMAPRKPESNGLITTPATYYSTVKARYLGARYKDNLDRLVERITRNPKTATLQFANNISSVGGIGFFTHSATKTPDERYLEVVLATPETFEVKGEFNQKVQRLFARYGVELLGIVSGDNEIYQDREISGYGLNLAWRNILTETAGNRVALERAIIYFPKERVRNLVREGLTPNDLLSDAVIFAVEEDGPLKLVSYRPQESKSDVRAAIKEDNLATASKTLRSPGAAAEDVRPEKSLKTAETEQAVANPNNDSVGPAASPGEAKAVKLPEPVALPTASAKSVERGQPIEMNRPAKVAKPAAAPLPDAPPVPASEKGLNRPLALLKNRPAEGAQEKPAAVLPAVKPLEGYIVQLAFNDKEKAQRWADSMVQRGYAVSLTEVGTVGTEGSLRVRVGNFTARDQAEGQLRRFKRDGLKGIVISLPQAFRPAVHTSVP